MLGLRQEELSILADVGISTLKRIELAGELTGSARTIWKIQAALEAKGVVFIPSDEILGPGVRLDKPVELPK